MRIKVWALSGQPGWVTVDTDIVDDDEPNTTINFDTDGIPYLKSE